MQIDTVEDLFDICQPEPNTGCWLWTGRLMDFGYGCVPGHKSGLHTAHRLAWALANGPIPIGSGHHGTCVCHRCDTPSCCNPNHLFLGSMGDNNMDRVRKGRTASGNKNGAYTKPDRVLRGTKSGMAKLTDDDVLSIRKKYASGGVSQAKLALEYGVNQTNIGFIVRGCTWKHVHGLD